MATSTALHEALRARHEELNDRLTSARAVETKPEQTRRGCPPIDMFCSDVSKHLHAIDAVLVPAAQRAGASDEVHEYLRAAREVEVAIAHVKAHEYGSAYETSFDWDGLWDEVDHGLEFQWQHEQDLADTVSTGAPAEDVALLGAMATAERKAPTRPHPYLPHTGAGGTLSRGVMRLADRAWDAVEGRQVTTVRPAPKKKPGLIGQYFLADPRWDEKE